MIRVHVLQKEIDELFAPLRHVLCTAPMLPYWAQMFATMLQKGGSLDIEQWIVGNAFGHPDRMHLLCIRISAS
jgi:hypothetical protein